MSRSSLVAALASLSVVVGVSAATAQDTPIEAGQTLTDQRFTWGWGWGNRHHGAYDQYVLWMEPGDRVRIFTSNAVAAPSGGTVSGTIDTYLYLFNDAAGTTMLAEDDDSGGGLQASIVYTASRQGLHYVRLRAYDEWSGATWEERVEGVGHCSLTYVRLPDTAPNPALAPFLAYDQPQTVTFFWNGADRWDGNHAMFQTLLLSGKTLTFLTRNCTSGDSVLYLQDAAGNILDVDDDGGDNLASRIVFRAPTTMVLFIKVRPYTGQGTGTCDLLATRQKHPDLMVPRNGILTPSLSSTGSVVTADVANVGDAPLDFTVSTFTITILGVEIERFNLSQTLFRTGASTFTRSVFRNGSFFTPAGALTCPPMPGRLWNWPRLVRVRLRDVGLHGAVGAVRTTAPSVLSIIQDCGAGPFDSTVPGAPPAAFYVHGLTTGGISIGWKTTNNIGLTLGSSSNTPTGEYWLEVEADPDGAIWERDHAFKWNNVVRRRVFINRSSMTVTFLD